jgi:hypothetical protein
VEPISKIESKTDFNLTEMVNALTSATRPMTAGALRRCKIHRMSPFAIVAIKIAAIVVVGTLTGNEIAVAVFFHPRISRLEDAVHARAAQTLASALGAAMPFWYGLALLLSLVATFLGHASWTTPRWLALSSAAILAFTIIYTIMLPLPINNQVARWQPDSLPPNWRELRRRWDTFHGIRVGFLIVAFILLVAASVLPSHSWRAGFGAVRVTSPEPGRGVTPQHLENGS